MERPGKFYLEFLQGVNSFEQFDAEVCILYNLLSRTDCIAQCSKTLLYTARNLKMRKLQTFCLDIGCQLSLEGFKL